MLEVISFLVISLTICVVTVLLPMYPLLLVYYIGCIASLAVGFTIWQTQSHINGRLTLPSLPQWSVISILSVTISISLLKG